MKRALFKQMRHEWRDNIWLVLGLSIVCIAVWILTIMIVGSTRGLRLPLGADVENVCKISLIDVPESSEDYIDRGDDAAAGKHQDMRALIANIRKSPYVEAAAFSNNALPYNLSYVGLNLYIEGMEPKDTIGYPTNYRSASPDIVRVLRLHSRTGKSMEDLERLLQEGNLVISNYYSEEEDGERRSPEEMNGKTIDFSGEKRIGDIIDQVRRSDFDISYGGVTYAPINEEEKFRANEIAVRVKPGMKEKFRQQFENTPDMQRQGNKMLYELEYLEDTARSLQRSQTNELRMTLGLNICLVIIVGLGLLGVFWFRVQQRVSEIAIRKVCGAGNMAVFRRIISEGLSMLLVAAVIMICVGWPLIQKFFVDEGKIKNEEVIVAGILTLFLMAVAIVVCIWIPAYKATKIEPAIAVKDE